MSRYLAIKNILLNGRHSLTERMVIRNWKADAEKAIKDKSTLSQAVASLTQQLAQRAGRV